MSAPSASRFVCSLLAVGALLSCVSSVHAEQPRDYLVRPSGEGNRLFFDVLPPGAMRVGLENRRSYHGPSNQLTLRAVGLLAAPFASGELAIEMRNLLWTTGLSVGYIAEWQGYLRRPGQRLTRRLRLDRNGRAYADRFHYPFVEARGSLALPFNDWFLVNIPLRLRWDGAPDSFDWFTGTVHDADLLASITPVALFHSEELGGLGVQGQIISTDLTGGDPTTLWQVGVLAFTRLGLFADRDDLLLFFLLVDLVDETGEYGSHIYQLPVQLIFAYRQAVDL